MFVPTYSRICVMNSAPSRVEIDFPRLSSQLPFTRGQDRRTGEGILDCPKAKDRTPGLAHGESTEIIMSPTVRNAVPSRSIISSFELINRRDVRLPSACQTIVSASPIDKLNLLL